MDTIKRSEAAKLAGTSTGNIQRLESLGDFPKRVQRGEPGSPALYSRREVEQWIFTRRKSPNSQPPTRRLRRIFGRQKRDAQKLSQEHDQLQERYAALVAEHAELEKELEEEEAAELEAKRLLRQTEHLKDKAEATCASLQATLTIAHKHYKALTKQRNKAVADSDKAINSRDTALKKLEDDKTALTDTRTSLKEARDQKHLVSTELEQLRAQLAQPITPPTPLPDGNPPLPPGIGRGHRQRLIEQAKLKRLHKLELRDEQQRQEIANLQALVTNLQALVANLQASARQPHTNDPFDSEWALRVLNAKRADLDDLHADLFGRPPHRQIGVDSLRKKLLKHGGWKLERGKLRRTNG